MQESDSQEFLEVYTDGEPEGSLLGVFEPGADMPVPDRLLPKWKSQWLLRRLKLSQSIGLLLFLNREGQLSRGGQDRLIYLQQKASIEAIQAGIRFYQRLLSEPKLQSDFKHQKKELNRRPQSKRYRRYETSRIGVGYRDKGTLPSVSKTIRAKANSDSFVCLTALEPRVEEFVRTSFPSLVDGEWIDLELLSEEISSFEEEHPEQYKLLLALL
jgi:hypothetical protein